MRKVFSALLVLFAVPALAGEPPKAGASPTGGFEAVEQAEDARLIEAPALQEAVQSTDARLRARAATALGRIQKPQAVDPLLKLLADPDLSVRGEAIFALGQLGWLTEAPGGREAEISGKLAVLLADPDEATRALAAEALGKIGRMDAPSLLLPALKDASAKVRAEAALGMFRYRLVERLHATVDPPPQVPDLPQDAMDALLALSKDSAPEVRRNVAYYFARVKDARGLETAIGLSKDRDPWVRCFAVMALGKLGAPQGAAAAREAAWDEQLPVRVAAVQSLAALKLGDMLPTELTHDSSFHVRAASASAISDEKILLELWADPSFEVRAAALTALVGLKKAEALPLLQQAQASSSRLLRATAVEAAADLPEAASILEAALSDPEELVRVTALEAVSKAQTPKAFEAIRKSLGATGIGERGTAVEALRTRQEPETLELLGKAYADSQGVEWLEIRENIVDILASRPEPAAGELLKKALQDPLPSIASKAREALATKGATDLPPAPAMAAAPSVSPYASLRFTKAPVVILETTKGTLTIDCFPEDAPVHVANFIGLVKKGFYDGLPWHRVVSNFVIQGGDPLGTGWGDAGYTLRAEVNHRRYARGALGMPRGAGFDTGSCQLFFSLIPTPHLDGQYTVFGQVREGLDVLDKIERGDTIVRARVVE